MESGLTYTGPSNGDFNDPIALEAILASGDAPVSGKAILFTLGSKSCAGQTDDQGIATCSLTPTENAGSYPLNIGFAGDQNFKASSASTTFTVLKEQVKLAYSGDTSIHNGGSAHLSATLTEDGDSSMPLASRPVTFTLGAGSSAQSCTASTGSNGRASCSIAGVDQPVGSGTVIAAFAGDATYEAASDQLATQVLAAVVSPTPAPSQLPMTGAAPATGSGVPWGWLGLATLLLGLVLFVLPHRGETAPIIWRNRE
jgi:hypothetical protein